MGGGGGGGGEWSEGFKMAHSFCIQCRKQSHRCNVLTNSLSEGTRDKKSSNSLLLMALGLRNFFVNLLIPGKSTK